MVKERIKNLMDMITKKEVGEDLEMLIDLVEGFAKNCTRYVETVVNLENAINVSRFHLEADEYRKLVTNLDTARSRAHDVVISDCRILNRIAEDYGLSPIYEGSLSDRLEVAEFAKTYIDELWEERKK